jgi:hypothetical protein
MVERSDNEQHLRLLGVFHYVVAVLTALFALFPLIHLTVGWFLLHAPPSKQGQPPPAFVGYMFMVFGAVFFLLGQSFAACVFAAGRCIRFRTRYWFVFVMACLQCAFFPFGTVLGVFTIVVLSRPAVKQMFGLQVIEQPPTI